MDMSPMPETISVASWGTSQLDFFFKKNYRFKAFSREALQNPVVFCQKLLENPELVLGKLKDRPEVENLIRLAEAVVGYGEDEMSVVSTLREIDDQRTQVESSIQKLQGMASLVQGEIATILNDFYRDNGVSRDSMHEDEDAIEKLENLAVLLVRQYGNEPDFAIKKMAECIRKKIADRGGNRALAQALASNEVDFCQDVVCKSSQEVASLWHVDASLVEAIKEEYRASLLDFERDQDTLWKMIMTIMIDIKNLLLENLQFNENQYFQELNDMYAEMRDYISEESTPVDGSQKVLISPREKIGLGLEKPNEIPEHIKVLSQQANTLIGEDRYEFPNLSEAEYKTLCDVINLIKSGAFDFESLIHSKRTALTDANKEYYKTIVTEQDRSDLVSESPTIVANALLRTIVPSNFQWLTGKVFSKKFEYTGKNSLAVLAIESTLHDLYKQRPEFSHADVKWKFRYVLERHRDVIKRNCTLEEFSSLPPALMRAFSRMADIVSAYDQEFFPDEIRHRIYNEIFRYIKALEQWLQSSQSSKFRKRISENKEKNISEQEKRIVNKVNEATIHVGIFPNIARTISRLVFGYETIFLHLVTVQSLALDFNVTKKKFFPGKEPKKPDDMTHKDYKASIEYIENYLSFLMR